MLVYVAVALALALVLRRGDTAGVIGGVVLGVALVCGVRARDATLPRPDRVVRRPNRHVSSCRTGGILELRSAYWRRSVLLAALGFVAHARRSAAIAGRRCGAPRLRDDAVLHVLARRLGGAHDRLREHGRARPAAIAPARVTTVVAAPSAACDRVSHRSAMRSRLSTRLSMTAAGDGHRVAVVLAVLRCVLTATLSIAARQCRPQSRRLTRARRVFDGSLVAVALLGVVAVVLSRAAAPRAAVTELEGRIRRSGPVGDVYLNKRLFSVSGNGRSEQLRVAWDAGRDQPTRRQRSWHVRVPVVRAAPELARRARRTLPLYGDVRGARRSSDSRSLCTAFSSCSSRELVPAGRGSSHRARAHCFAWMAASAFDWHWEVVGVTLTALLAGSAGLLASERMTPRVAPKQASSRRSSD